MLWKKTRVRIRRIVKKLIENPARSYNFNSKSDALQKNYFKSWHVEKFSIWKLIFSKKSFIRVVHFKKHTTCEICRIYGVKRIKIDFLQCIIFFENPIFEKKVRNLTHLKFSILNLTKQKLFFSNSDFLFKFFIQNLTQCIFCFLTVFEFLVRTGLI